MVDAGIELLLADGLGTGAEGLTLKRVLDRLRTRDGIHLTNASVLGRAFRDQRELQLEVLATVAASPSQDFRDLADVLVGDVLVHTDRSTLEGRWQCVSDICRVTGTVLMDTLRGSDVWRAWIGIWALAASAPASEETARLTSALVHSYRLVTDDAVELYEAVTTHLGFRVRMPYSMAAGASAIQALAEGCALRDLLDPEAVRGLHLPTGPGGSDEEWTVFGMALHTLVRTFLEPVPGWVPDGVADPDAGPDAVPGTPQ
jgi:hypothetical protein